MEMGEIGKVQEPSTSKEDHFESVKRKGIILNKIIMFLLDEFSDLNVSGIAKHIITCGIFFITKVLLMMFDVGSDFFSG